MTMKFKVSDYPDRLTQIYGALIALGLIAYFWLAKILGFINIPEFRLFNVVIQTAGIYLACKQFRQLHAGSINYFRAMAIGFITSTIGTTLFAMFLFILFQIDKPLFESIIRDEPLRTYLTVYMATFAVWTEGMVSGTVATFLLTNIMDSDQP
ncbi:DUF4199 domain-containing protein [Chryseolinea soli]|uniref:DUF4199 domain-containing protein n=1 Tax=Chryseolinea soli TaxID=2321403 RepID=A0A385STE9_9BACT|nr:DUF4199 domain-containing protein [Chryseolinea soli]AYB35113.1 DUF4199 domain-containing protein [Chryseolinea soli]